jgi:hypothetical protein
VVAGVPVGGVARAVDCISVIGGSEGRQWRPSSLWMAAIGQKQSLMP